MIALAKRMPGIEDVIAGIKPQKMEERRLVADGKSVPVKKMLRVLEQFLNDASDCIVYSTIQTTDILSPEEINIFHQLSIKYEDKEFYHQILSTLLTELINNSYKAGYNDFRLHLSVGEDHYFNGLGLKWKKIPLRMNIEGDLGEACCNKTSNAKVHISGSVGAQFACLCNNSQFYVASINGAMAFISAANCTYTLSKLHPEAFLTEYFGIVIPPEKCIFRTENKETLAQLERMVPANNRVILINPDGTETIMRDYR